MAGIIFAIVTILLVAATYRLLQIGKREPGLPPGPPTIPIFGNMLQIPITQTEYQLGHCSIGSQTANVPNRMTEWHKQYGPIFSLKLGSGTLIVMNDREAIRELWEKRSQNYSDRTPSYVAGLLTRHHHAVFQSANETWRDRRKLISQFYSPQKCDRDHAPYQDAEWVRSHFNGFQYTQNLLLGRLHL
jgi:hypothetical protein